MCRKPCLGDGLRIPLYAAPCSPQRVKTKAHPRKDFFNWPVDDLVDTGGTAVAIREMYPKARFVTIFAKPAGKPLVDDYVIDIPQGLRAAAVRPLIAILTMFYARLCRAFCFFGARASTIRVPVVFMEPESYVAGQP
ncbi:hypothetical protein GCM10011513_00340 [Franconibacter daqui]|nr:hypothetical protein GCM10011513_00340 [Franconibacter daqui]